jgi:hypothetical protein
MGQGEEVAMGIEFWFIAASILTYADKWDDFSAGKIVLVHSSLSNFVLPSFPDGNAAQTFSEMNR